MSVLEMLDKLDQIEILYEPIYSADGHRVVAYEVIGQVDGESGIINMEQFTYEQDVPADIRAEIEQLFVRKSLQSVAHLISDVGLYIPCNPNLLMLDYGESYFAMLKELIAEQNLSQITLVMAEHKFAGEIKQLHHLIRYIKTYGVKIALSEVGSQTQLENLLMLEPAVLKINVGQLNYNLWGSQNHAFATIRALAVKMGTLLLIENIGTVYQLQQGWKNGARFFKGPYLQLPDKQFNSRDSLKERFRSECEQFIATEKKQLLHKYEEMKRLEKTICTIVEQVNPSGTQPNKLMQLAKALQNCAFRLYICDNNGFQTSPNIRWKEGQWEVQEEALGKNWSWRPYFLLNIIKLAKDHQGDLSSVYSDIETGDLTRTYSMALASGEFLFIDISYDYLYEHNIVN
ncbi:EAL-associated domain-containing protein [Solibacillus sp. FSL R7-0668]|uniref:EAL-associated domain-containing protein n=1 Tax=Solibacillus sp. FSL R7-0668 TaxID=2921688 RepID=UPI0030F6C5D7